MIFFAVHHNHAHIHSKTANDTTVLDHGNEHPQHPVIGGAGRKHSDMAHHPLLPPGHHVEEVEVTTTTLTTLASDATTTTLLPVR